LCSFFSFGNCNKLPNNGSPGMAIIKIQTHYKKKLVTFNLRRILE
jgi:hypothetical protein